MTIKDKWIRACKKTLQEYENGTHNYHTNKCSLCTLVNKYTEQGNQDVVCIFGKCTTTFPCTKMLTYPVHKIITETRIIFYRELIKALNKKSPEDFHKANFHKLAKLCKEIDNRVYNN